MHSFFGIRVIKTLSQSGERFINPDLSMGTKILRGAHKSYLLISKIPLVDWIFVYPKCYVTGKIGRIFTI